MITINVKGNFNNTEAFLKKMRDGDIFSMLESIAREGLAALASATPSRSGLTANSWDYVIEQTKGSWTITYINSNIVDGVPLVILIQYGHGTGTGGYVRGIDFINPALKPIFDRLADQAWKAVTSA